MSPLQQSATRLLNWASLMRWFALEPPRELFPRGIYRSDAGMLALMKAAGFRLKRRERSLVAHDFWIFERDDASAQP